MNEEEFIDRLTCDLIVKDEFALYWSIPRKKGGPIDPRSKFFEVWGQLQQNTFVENLNKMLLANTVVTFQVKWEPNNKPTFIECKLVRIVPIPK